MAISKRYSKTPLVRGSKKLEMIVRNMLDDLEDSVCELSLRPAADNLEILSIEAPEVDAGGARNLASVHPLPTPPSAQRSSDIVSYLIAREEYQQKRRA